MPSDSVAVVVIVSVVISNKHPAHTNGSGNCVATTLRTAFNSLPFHREIEIYVPSNKHTHKHSTVAPKRPNHINEAIKAMHPTTEFGNVCVKHVRCSVLNVTFLGTPRALCQLPIFIHSV